MALPNILLLRPILFRRQLTGRENALTDILSVVVDTLVQKFGIDDHLTSSSANFAVVVTEQRVEQVVTLCLITNELFATKRVEGLVLGAITTQKLVIRQSLHGFRLVEFDATIVNCVADLTLIAH